MAGSEKKIYIIVSQTGTLPSWCLRQITGADYNHVSISLHADLQKMYSFGRRYKYYPFWGGFVAESPAFGTFQRFPDARIKVLALNVTAEQYDSISSTIETMFQDRKRYHYDYLGVGLAYFRIRRRSRRSYYCSEFVREILLRHGVSAADALPKIVQPIHFLDIPGVETIYAGCLRDYAI